MDGARDEQVGVDGCLTLALPTQATANGRYRRLAVRLAVGRAPVSQSVGRGRPSIAQPLPNMQHAALPRFRASIFVSGPAGRATPWAHSCIGVGVHASRPRSCV